MFFVLNTGRSGSQTIANVLSQSANCTCLHEPEPALIEDATRYRYGSIGGDHIKKLLQRTRPAPSSEQQYGESNNKLALLVPVLEAAFPKSNYVWLLRDGRDVVCSALQRGWYSDQDYGRDASLWSKWRLQGDLLGVVAREEWASWGAFERNCWLWSYTNGLIQTDLERLGGERQRALCIEALETELPQLCDFLGIAIASFNIDRLNARYVGDGGLGGLNRVEHILSWRDWDVKQRGIFEHHCGELMDRCYPNWRRGKEWQPIAKERGGSKVVVTFDSRGGLGVNREGVGEGLEGARGELVALKQIRGELRGMSQLYRTIAEGLERTQQSVDAMRDSEKENLARIQYDYAQMVRGYDKQKAALARRVRDLETSTSWRLGQALVRPARWLVDWLGVVIRQDEKGGRRTVHRKARGFGRRTAGANVLENRGGPRTGPVGSKAEPANGLAVRRTDQKGFVEAASLRKMGRSEEAWLQILSALLDRAELAPKELLEFATLAELRGDWKLGRLCLAKTLAIDPANRRALELDRRVCVRNLELGALREEVARRMRGTRAERDAFRQCALFIAFYEDRDWQETIRLCQDFPELTVLGGVHRILARLERGDFRAASADLKRLERAFPNDDEILLLGAEAARRAGDRSGCVAGVNRVLGRHGLAEIQSSHPDQQLSVPYLQCPLMSKRGGGPLISVIMAVYGGDGLLPHAIASMLEQTHENLELLIIDDCSTDDTCEWLIAHARKDPRVQVLKTERNSGPYVAKNIGLRECRGDYITFMDSDDWAHPQRLERQLARLERNPGAYGVCQRYFRVDEAGGIVFRQRALRMAAISLMFPRAVLERIGYFVSIRAGADVEYIGRIKAVFGDEAVENDPSLGLIATHHAKSLTGGGRFSIDWRSIRGPRYDNARGFSVWHAEIRSGLADAFMSFPMREPPYAIPAELLA